MTHPFLYIGHGKIAPDSIGKDDAAVLVLEKKPTAAQQRAIERACPPPIAGGFAWKGATLTASSDGDTFDVTVAETYGSAADRRSASVSHEAAEAFAAALERWVVGVHAETPVRAFVAPGRVDGLDAWDDWSRDALAQKPIAGLERHARRAAGPTGAPVADRAYAKAAAIIKKRLGKPADTVDLSELGLTRLPPELFDLDIRTWLMLDENKLVGLPPEIAKLRRMKQLIVRLNPLESLPDELAKLPLQQLDLGLSLAGVRDASVVCRIPTLTSLDLRGLARLPEGLTELPKLRSLAVGNARLEGLDVLWKLRSLETLELTDAGLEELPPGIGELGELRDLYLSGNKLRRLPREIVRLGKLKKLDLEKNPLPGLARKLLDAGTRKQVAAVFAWVESC